MRKLICLLLVSVMAVGLVACGGVKMDDLVGEYQFIKMKEGKDVYNKKDIDQLNGLVKMGFEIKKDGTAVLTLADEVSKGKVDVDKQTITFDGKKEKFTYKDDTLKVFEKKDYMVLKKKKK